MFLAKGATVRSLAGRPPAAFPEDLSGEDRILFDEVRPPHLDYLERLATDSPNTRIFASAQDTDGLHVELVPLLIEPLNEREIRTAVEAWFPTPETAGSGAFKVLNRAAEAFHSAMKADSRIRLLASNPLNLFMLLQVYTQGAPLPARRTALFETFVSAKLQDGEIGGTEQKGEARGERIRDLPARSLEGIALATKRGEVAKAEHLSRGYGFLSAGPTGRVEFVHPLLNDFFAARALRRNPDLEPLLEHVMDEGWHDVVLFYAGLGDSRTLVESLLKRDQLKLAALALAESPDIPADLQKRLVEPLIKRAWDEGDATALEALCALRSSEATDFFAARLKERDPNARARAALTLGRLNTDRAVEYLLPQLRDTNADVRDQVLASLGQSTSDRVIEPLLVALRGDSRVGAVDRRMRLAAARALGDVGTERAVPALIVDLQVGEPELRAEAVWALVKIRSPLAVKPLHSIAESGQPDEVRLAAEQILQEI
jgi:HEAT repeats